MVESNVNPKLIHVDRVRKGIAEILVRWSITEIKKATEEGIPYTDYQYDERRIEWILPEPYKTIEEVQKYLDANYDTGDNILNWAKASKVTITETVGEPE
ncbi:MAG: hypothetical protein WC877_01650 [Dehalococcoidales bacterium]|jgi:hypothetical protein